MEATVHVQSFNRRSFLGKLAGSVGATVLLAATAGCQSVQQALGPKTNQPTGGTTGASSTPGARAATSGTPATTGAAAPAQGGAVAAATIRYMGHFTALGDTARDRAQKQIDE